MNDPAASNGVSSGKLGVIFVSGILIALIFFSYEQLIGNKERKIDN